MTRSDLALAASNVLLGTAAGASVTQSLFVVPKLFESPLQSLASVPTRSQARFWGPLQIGMGVALASALVFNRRDRDRRRFLAAGAGLYLANALATGIYFAPEIIRVTRPDSGLPASEIVTRGKRWLGLNWLRTAAIAGAWVLTLSALARR